MPTPSGVNYLLSFLIVSSNSPIIWNKNQKWMFKSYMSLVYFVYVISVILSWLLLIEILSANVIVCIHLKRLLILGRKRFRSSTPFIAQLTLLLVLIILTTIGSCTICGSSSTSSYFFIYYYIFLCAKLRNLFLSSKFFRIFFAKRRVVRKHKRRRKSFAFFP